MGYLTPGREETKEMLEDEADQIENYDPTLAELLRKTAKKIIKLGE